MNSFKKLDNNRPLNDPLTTPQQPDLQDKELGPEDSFHDDNIAAQLKLQEMAKNRAFLEKLPLEQQKNLEEATKNLQKQAQKQKLSQKFLALSQKTANKTNKRIIKNLRSSDNLHDIQLNIHGKKLSQLSLTELYEHLAEMSEHMHVISSDIASIELQPTELINHLPSQYTLEQFEKMKMQMKELLQMILLGGAGLMLQQDPRATFKPLFRRFKRWPSYMPPGYFPESDEDFDVFVGWIFTAPDHGWEERPEEEQQDENHEEEEETSEKDRDIFEK